MIVVNQKGVWFFKNLIIIYYCFCILKIQIALAMNNSYLNIHKKCQNMHHFTITKHAKRVQTQVQVILVAFSHIVLSIQAFPYGYV